MYTQIINPLTNRKVNIYTKLGNEILFNYVQYGKGTITPSQNKCKNRHETTLKRQGKNKLCNDDQICRPKTGNCVKIKNKSGKKAKREWSELDALETVQDTSKKAVTSVLKEPKSPEKDIKHRALKNCRNKLLSKLGPGGTFKQAYIPDCSYDKWETEDGDMRSFIDENCNDSTMLLSINDVKSFNQEVEKQNQLSQIKVLNYGQCGDNDTGSLPWSNLINKRKPLNKWNYKIEKRYDMDLFDFNIKLTPYNGYIYIYNTPNELFFRQKIKNIVENIKFLHDQSYGHFDIKPENIMIKFSSRPFLITNIDKIILIDYGYATRSPVKKLIGTTNFMDPMIKVTSPEFTLKYDIFSLAIVLLDSYTPGHPFINTDFNTIWSDFKQKYDFKNEKAYLTAFLDNKGFLCPKKEESEQDWITRIIRFIDTQSIPKPRLYYRLLSEKSSKYKSFLNLLYNMLILNLDKRYSIDEVLDHEFFSSI